MELRPYQIGSKEAALDYFENGSSLHSPIIVAPTGGGKSVIIAAITKEVPKDTLILQPSKELLEQNYEKFRLAGGEASMYSASVGVKEIGDVTFATIGSVANKPEVFSHFKRILIDECHLLPPKEDKITKNGTIRPASMFVSFLNSVPSAKVVGLTATAFRMKKYRDRFTGQPYSQINLLPYERPHFFNKFLHVTQISELYDTGFLAPVRYIPMAWEAGQLKVNTTGAEFTDESIEDALVDQMVYQRLPGIIKQSVEKGRKYRLVFVKSVARAMQLTGVVPHSACVHAETKKKERDDILKKFKSGDIHTIFNVGVLTVGFDFPALDTIIIARPTMSLALYMQMIGRGIRPHVDKDNCAVVDMCGNINRFGEIEKIRYEEIGGKWCITSEGKVLSGVRLDSIR